MLKPDVVARVPKLAAEICTHGIACVWSSSASRCRILAEAVVAIANVPLRVDPRLQELDFGAWEGLAWDDVPRHELDNWSVAPLSFAPPGGESGQALLDRVSEVYNAVRAVGEDCVLVSHGGPLKILTALFRGETPDLFAPTAVTGSVTVIAC